MAKLYINYITDYGDAPSQVSVDVTDGASFAFTEEHLPTLSADGYKFEGWLFAGALISAGYTIDEVDEDMAFTLIAKWSKEQSVCGNATGGFGMPKMIEVVDEDGNTFIGTVTDSEVTFTATDNDVRLGMTYASEAGVSTGTKDIPAYRITEGYRVILAGSPFSINLPLYNGYDYTKLQCIISPFNTNIDKSVAVDKTVINNSVYEVGSIDKISEVEKNHTSQSVDLNIINTTESPYVIRFFTYKEEI